MAGLKSKAAKLGNQAAERVMKNEKAMAAILTTVLRVQAGKKSLDQLGDGLLHALGFAARGDYKALGKRISGLKKKIRETSAKLDALR
jgi:hypothetical protein